MFTGGVFILYLFYLNFFIACYLEQSLFYFICLCQSLHKSRKVLYEYKFYNNGASKHTAHPFYEKPSLGYTEVPVHTLKTECKICPINNKQSCAGPQQI